MPHFPAEFSIPTEPRRRPICEPDPNRKIGRGWNAENEELNKANIFMPVILWQYKDFSKYFVQSRLLRHNKHIDIN